MNYEEDPTEVGVPIGGLTEVGSDVSARFLTIIRNKIQRRTAVAQFANFSWTLPSAIFVEFITLLAHLISAVEGKKVKRQ